LLLGELARNSEVVDHPIELDPGLDMRVDQEPRLPSDKNGVGVASVVAYLFGEQQIDRVEGVHPGDLAKLGLSQRPKVKDLGRCGSPGVNIPRTVPGRPVFPVGVSWK